MKLPEICIRRPVLSIVLSIVLLIVGGVTLNYLPLRYLPQIEVPVISVTTTYTGASPKIIETQVTRTLESALAGIEGLDHITSTSETEFSRINLYFKPDRSIDDAASDVRDRIARIKMKLPPEAKDTTIKKSDADAVAVIYLALFGKDYDTAELFDYAKNQLQSEIEALPGVSGVDIMGAAGHAMHVWLEPVKMSSYRITAHDVIQALKRQNVNIPAGRLVGKDREFMLTTSASLKNIDAFKNVIVGNSPDGHLIKVRDIGRVEFSPAEERSAVRYNDQPAISLGIIKKSVANPLEVSKEVQKLLPDLQKKLPKGMEVQVVFDKSVYIDESLNEVYKTFRDALICVFFVILLFLWSFRSALIPLVTIPVSLIATSTLLFALGYSLNTLTLLAVVLAIGLVVDDAIVVMENVHRYLEKGMKPIQAAIKGSKEISFAIIAMTLTLAAVYAPISLSTGRIGKLFTEFSVALAGSVIISGFVALTLSPMMCSRLMRASSSHKLNFFDAFMHRLIEKYKAALTWCMNQRGVVTIIALFLAIAGALIGLRGLKSELAPREDQGVVYASALVPQGATVDYVKKYMNHLEQAFREVPEVKNRFAISANPNPTAWNILVPWNERERSSLDIIKDVKEKLDDIPGILAYSHPGSSGFGASGGQDESLQFVLQTTKSQSELDIASAQLESALRKTGILRRLNTNRGEDTQEFVISINRDKASSLGVDVSVIGETLDTFISGRRVSDFNQDSEQFDVLVSVDREGKKSPNDLSGMYVRGHKDAMIPLSNIVEIKKEVIPVIINHYNQQRSVTLSGTLPSEVSLGEAVETFRDLADKILPEHINTTFAGETKQFLEARYVMYMIFGLALVFIYLVMAAQFESFIDPFIIMLSVPLSLSGAVITLLMTGGTINIYTQIGLLTLIGLITKHGILIVDFANKRQAEGEGQVKAVIEAARLRLRPILMTTAAMVLGAIPLVWASGAGAASRTQLGWTLFGGLIIGTFFTLFVVPVVYTFFSRERKKEAL